VQSARLLACAFSVFLSRVQRSTMASVSERLGQVTSAIVGGGKAATGKVAALTSSFRHNSSTTV
jgi:hypothetical protein